MKPTKPIKALEQQYNAALARAEHDNVRVVAKVSDHWLVTSSQPGHHYMVRVTGEELMLDTFSCPCQTEHDQYLCKHRAVAFAFMVAQMAQRAAAAAEAKDELLAGEAAKTTALTLRGERELAGAVWNQVELLWLVVYAPLVEIAAGAAMGQQAKLDKEAKWQAYQAARQNEWYC